MVDSSIRILLVEDDPDDYVLTRDLLGQIQGSRVDLQWATACSAGLHALREQTFDVILLDYHLGAETGLDFLVRMPLDLHTPVILLTGQANRQTDLRAMRAGAADYLVKGEITPTLLERSIRYAIERQQAQESQRRAEEFRAGQARVLEMVARGYPLNDVLGELVLKAQARRDLRCAILLVDETGTKLRLSAAPSLPEELRTAGEGILIGPGNGSCGTSAHLGETVVVTDVATNPLWESYRGVAERAGVGACWSRPILASTRQVLGTVCTYYRAARPPTAEEEGLIENVSQIAAIAIERHRSETALRESEERFRTLVHATAQIVWKTDGVGNGLRGNPAWVEFTGQTPAEIEGWGWLNAVHPGDRESLVEARQRSIEKKQVFEWEHRLRRHDGEYRHMQVRAVPLLEPDGSIREWVGTHTDITQRKAAECAVRASEAKFQQVAAHIPQVIWIFDPDFTQALYISPAYEQIWGVPVDTVYRDPGSFGAAVHPEDVQRLRDRMAQVKNGFTEACEYRILHPSGEERWLRSRGFPVRDENGIAQRVVGTTEDITDLVRARLELERSEERYRRLVRTAPQAIYALDIEGRFVEANAAAEELLGRPATELIGQAFAAVVAPEDLPRLAALRQQKMAEGDAVVEVECEIVRRSGERRRVRVNAATVREGDRVVGTHGIARDITEERAREGRMRLLTSVMDGLEQGVSIVDSETLQILYRNTAWARLLGVDEESAQPHTLEDFLPDDAAREQFAEIRFALRQDGQWSGRISRKRISDERVIPLDVVFGTAEGEGLRPVIFSVFHDAGVEIEREQRLRRAERLASLGTLIGGVAHELNNPLHAIRNFADLMLLEDRNADDLEALEIMRREADRAAKIVSDLRLFARQTQDGGEAQREAVDLNDVVQHVLKVRGYTLHTQNVRVRQDLGEHLPRVWANRSGIEQVVLNLVINAEQALLGKGSADRLLILRTRGSRKGAMIQVVDNGPGIAPEHLDRIFDPFFTTKPPGEGTGLGLSLAHGIAEEHGGELRAESEPGRGAAFALDLPRAPAVDEAEDSGERAAVTTAERALRVLVVDDEESVRRIAIRVLERRGHHVDSASDGSEALGLLGTSEYDVILSDLRMPGLDGEELLRRLQARGDRMERRVVLLTGDAARAPVGMGVPVLTKPIDMAEVVRLVEQWAQPIVLPPGSHA